ncbi:IS110 family transposase [Pseudalkalibacillus sp. A8]|uniref:IS110 family transposase n=1 Tax=Pseudalkalibacillus sp. A8 TaxID=3382641 RepID=UPI0038B5C31F
MHFIGIDLADKKHDICILDPSGKVLNEFIVSHSPEGLDQLLDTIRSIPEDQPILIAAETPRYLFIQYLHALGYTVFGINPKSVDRARDRFSPAGAKDDKRDTRVLADLLRTDRHQYRPIRVDNDFLIELKHLVHDRETLVSNLKSVENQIRSCLKDYYPRALECFSKLDQKVTIAFLRRYPTPTAFNNASYHELAQIFKEGHHPKWRTKAEELAKLAKRQQFHVDQATIRTKSRFLMTLLKQLELLLEDLLQYKKDIDTLVKLHPDSGLFLNLRGVGANLAARLLVHFGDDRDYYSHANAVQCEAGTAPVTRRSGKKKTVRFRRACQKSFRNTMQNFAIQMVRFHEWSKKLFLEHRRRGRSKSECYRIVANKWLKILFAMWKKRVPYDPDIYLKAKQQQAA